MNSERHLLSLAAALITAVIFIVVYRSAPQPPPEHSIETAPPAAVGTTLKMSPRLVSVPAERSATTRSQPDQRDFSPIRPVLLFLLAFASGWWLRQWIRSSQQLVSPAEHVDAGEEDDITEADDNDQPADFPTVFIPAAESEPDDLDDDLTNTAQIEVLQEKNITKAKIIKALEEVVVENREKWIHWDETEARMSTQIDELTQELNNAMRQAFSSPEKAHKPDQPEPK